MTQSFRRIFLFTGVVIMSRGSFISLSAERMTPNIMRATNTSDAFDNLFNASSHIWMHSHTGQSSSSHLCIASCAKKYADVKIIRSIIIPIRIETIFFIELKVFELLNVIFFFLAAVFTDAVKDGPEGIQLKAVLLKQMALYKG